MEIILFITALITCITLALTLIESTLGFKQIMSLTNIKTLPNNKLPSVSIVFSARNEEQDIENSLNSMLKLNYQNLEIIAINDRSEDNTPQILNNLAKANPNKLKVIHITELPEGFLGKNHALNIGANHATGEWLLFTDADVIMKPGLLLKSLSYTLKHKLDHLTIFEHHLSQKIGMKIAHLGQYIAYTLAFKPWRIRFSFSKKYLGHGSFNLVSKKVYDQSKGYKAIPMECLDDLKLGELIKKSGFRQDIIDGHGFIEREWYNSLPEMIKGLEKNSFAVYGYKLLPVTRDLFFCMVFFIWPVIAVCTLNNSIAYINVFNVLLTFSFSIVVANQFKLNKIYALLYPISISLLLYTVINSIIKTYLNKGIIWRGTYYPIDSLRK